LCVFVYFRQETLYAASASNLEMGKPSNLFKKLKKETTTATRVGLVP